MRFNPDPFFVGEPIIDDNHEVFDSCLALAPDLSSLGRIFFDARTPDFEEKAMPLPEEHK